MPYRAKRHYSIVEGDKQHLTFAVKRDVTTDHEVKFLLYYTMSYQKEIQLTFLLQLVHSKVSNLSNEQLFLGSGIGITPLVPMFNEVVENGSKAKFIQVINDVNDIPFESLITEIADKSENADYQLYDKNEQGYLDKEN